MRFLLPIKLTDKLYALIKHHGVSMALSLTVVLAMLLHASNVLPLRFINQLENYSYDLRLNLLMPRTVDKRIVIVDIDEKSLAEQGRWPWGRNKLALMIDTLFVDYNINTLGFDVVFAEKDESSGLNTLKMMQDTLKNDAAFASAFSAIEPKLDYDQIFADSLKNRKVVLGYYFQTSGDNNRIGQLPAEIFSVDSFDSANLGFAKATGYGANLAVLQKNAFSAGHFNPEPDEDGITRKISVFIQYQQNYYESLALAVARAYLNTPVIEAKFASFGVGENYAGLESFKLGNKRVPVDGNIASLVPYRGAQGSFQYISASDVLNKKIPVATLKNKIVLVGTTAPGLMDLRSTPVQSNYPGVEVHANFISGILDNNLKQRPAFTNGIEFILIILAGLLLTFTLPHLNPLKASLLTLGVLGAILGINFASWQLLNLVLPIAASLLMISFIYLLNMSYGFFVESRAKRQLTGLFGQYVPPDLVAEMADNPEAINLKGESRDMTVLFSDVRGFTTISEGLDPAQLALLMNEFLSPMTKIIHEHRGTIDKYMGDAIMAFWGAPLPDEQHAQHALNAALQMQAATVKISEQFVKKGWPAIKMGFGLNTGNMVVGNMGSSFRMAYTVMGDSVNLGSRLESLTKNYGVDIIVSEYVKAQVADMVYRELDTVRVKGKDKPVTIYEPIGKLGYVSNVMLNQLSLYEQALKSYKHQHWDTAVKQFKMLDKSEPHALNAMYLTRIKQFKQTPPPKNWDGVFNYETK